MKNLLSVLFLLLSFNALAMDPPISLEAAKEKIESMDSGVIATNVMRVTRSMAQELDIYNDCPELQSRSAQAFTAVVNGRMYLYTTSEKVESLQLCRVLK